MRGPWSVYFGNAMCELGAEARECSKERVIYVGGGVLEGAIQALVNPITVP